MTTARPISESARREIELRAYRIWEREGRPQGREREHWLIAEAEILGVKPARKTARTGSNGKAASKAAPAEKTRAGKAKKFTKAKTGKPA